MQGWRQPSTSIWAEPKSNTVSTGMRRRKYRQDVLEVVEQYKRQAQFEEFVRNVFKQQDQPQVQTPPTYVN